MVSSELEKMRAGHWYSCIDPELEALRDRARKAVHAHNTMAPQERGNMAPALKQLMASVGNDVYLEAPFHCAYGMNIILGNQVYFNAGCTILDTARVSIGDSSMFGPAVQIYCAEHHKAPEKRVAGLEIAKPVTIGRNVWIGGGAIILPGVTIGDNAIVGSGSVVTRNVDAGATVVGNPARQIEPN
tara:strand:+ start:1810 stop:2367 length:558 start_codon:yes stop_codon:yes gene_type:complete